MKTQAFWITVEQMGALTSNSCRVATSMGQETDRFEYDQVRNLKTLCENELKKLDKLALNRGNGLKPGEKPCEEFSHTTSEKQ
ncbi:hypothetical protein [Vibrio sp. ABG19]|uniref:hypothetical protein n=1 Tax=Vibrio sp. ABG19 TaxID=2817385 RepID=UPI00249E712A|nr:hypothetical protein [Vibrio sp. ABG19]WGY45057.1 hypothetical protein J0X00_04970 [Vibrio sp. ABG19]